MDDLCPSGPRNSAASPDFQSKRAAFGHTGHDDPTTPLYKAIRWRRTFRRHCSFDGSGIVSGLCFGRIA
jgi:hypothetical protein